MNVKAKLMLFTAAIAFSGSLAQAAITAADVLQTYKDAGFSAVEVRETATTVKVEALKDGVKLELVYDKESGSVIKREQRALAGDGAQGTGASGHDDDQGDDHGSGSDDGADHDAGDDHGDHHGSGSDDGADHDAGDDHGGKHGGGEAGDDHGGKHGGGEAGDDHGGDDSDDDDN